MNQNWVLVAGSSEAELYAQEKPGASLIPVQTFSHTESRVLRQELASDKPGRAYDSFGAGRHGMDPENAVREEECSRFAREIVQELDRGLQHHEFEQLMVIAEPKFLGHLRKVMNGPLSGSIRKEIAKNLVGHDLSEIQAALPTRPWH